MSRTTHLNRRPVRFTETFGKDDMNGITSAIAVFAFLIAAYTLQQKRRRTATAFAAVGSFAIAAHSAAKLEPSPVDTTAMIVFGVFGLLMVIASVVYHLGRRP